jgi:plastocyanin
MKPRVTVIAIVLTIIGFGLSVSGALAADGPLANATVSFGLWKTDVTPPLDRYPNVSPPAGQLNEVIPNAVTIKAGGAINFVISGFHQIAVYDAGTEPGDIDENDTIDLTTPPVKLIKDPNDRIYRGLDPVTQPRDRVEAVAFAKPGTYLVICTVQPHFVNNDMFGYVKVLPANGK